MGTSTFFLTVRQTSRPLTVYRKFLWDGHQSLLKVAELNRIHLVWVSGHKGTDGNEIGGQLARQGSSHPLTGQGPGLSITAKVARGV